MDDGRHEPPKGAIESSPWRKPGGCCYPSLQALEEGERKPGQKTICSWDYEGKVRADGRKAECVAE